MVLNITLCAGGGDATSSGVYSKIFVRGCLQTYFFWKKIGYLEHPRFSCVRQLCNWNLREIYQSYDRTLNVQQLLNRDRLFIRWVGDKSLEALELFQTEKFESITPKEFMICKGSAIQRFFPQSLRVWVSKSTGRFITMEAEDGFTILTGPGDDIAEYDTWESELSKRAREIGYPLEQKLRPSYTILNVTLPMRQSGITMVAAIREQLQLTETQAGLCHIVKQAGEDHPLYCLLQTLFDIEAFSESLGWHLNHLLGVSLQDLEFFVSSTENARQLTTIIKMTSLLGPLGAPFSKALSSYKQGRTIAKLLLDEYEKVKLAKPFLDHDF